MVKDWSLILFFITSVSVLYVAYLLRAPFLRRYFKLTPTVKTPAHLQRDGMDFEPAKKTYLLSQHFSAIAAAGPIAGPILGAMYFGWFPAWVWIIVGSIFIGGIHDLAVLVASIRHRALSMAKLAQQHMNRRSFLLVLFFVWFTLVYLIVVFADITAGAFVQQSGDPAMPAPGPAVVTSSVLYIGLAMVMGLAIRFAGISTDKARLIFLPLVVFVIVIGPSIPFDITRLHAFARPQLIWDYLLLGYCFMSSIMPVWLLLQPRGDLGGYFLYLIMLTGIAGGIIGGVTGTLDIQAPAFTGFSFLTSSLSDAGKTIPPLFPILFITIACGACSGFHSIVAAGTTSKQLDEEPDAVPVAYGGMLMEAVIACISLAAFMIIANPQRTPDADYAMGVAMFINRATLGHVPIHLALQFGLLCFATFVFDSLDSATRMARYIFMELTGWTGTAGRVVATLLTLLVPAGMMSLPPVVMDGKPAPSWKVFWNIFGTSNQLLAALSLLIVSIWLFREGKRIWLTALPAVFMLVMTFWSLGLMSFDYFSRLAAGTALALHHVQFLVVLSLIVVAVWICVEAVRFFLSNRPAAPAAA
ncbi:MAG TPA: carbon starvation CstA family protein [bacterium]|nr:carbon starvation CstA family protein [bacterium]